MVIVKLKGGGEKVYFAEDQLYFENIPENNGAVGWVGYEFLPLSGPCVGTLTPYQEVASGYDNEKFNADYGATLGERLQTFTSAVTMVKDVDRETVDPAGTLVYTVAYTNTGGQPVGAPDIGAPLVIQDAIPAGTAYVSGSATNANVLPAGVAFYRTLFSTNNART